MSSSQHDELLHSDVHRKLCGAAHVQVPSCWHPSLYLVMGKSCQLMLHLGELLLTLCSNRRTQLWCRFANCF